MHTDTPTICGRVVPQWATTREVRLVRPPKRAAWRTLMATHHYWGFRGAPSCFSEPADRPREPGRLAYRLSHRRQRVAGALGLWPSTPAGRLLPTPPGQTRARWAAPLVKGNGQATVPFHRGPEQPDRDYRKGRHSQTVGATAPLRSVRRGA